MKHSFNRREFLRLAGYVGAGVAGSSLLAGCARQQAEPPAPSPSPAPTPAPQPASPAPSAPQVTTLTWITHPVFETVAQDLIDKYKQETGVEVILDKVPFPGLREKIYLELAAAGDQYDIVSISQDVWTWDINQALHPLDDFWTGMPPEEAGDVTGSLLDMFRAGDGKLYGWPLRSGVFILHYRKDLYEAAGLKVPATWDEYKANARALNKPPDQYGAFIMGTQDQFAMHDWMNYFFNFGGELLSADLKKCTVNSEAGYRATEFWIGLAAGGLTPPGSAAAKWDDLINAMQQGLAAQTVGWSPYAVNINDPAKSKFPSKYGWAVVPTDPAAGLAHSRTFLTCWGAFIPKATKKKEAAWKFLTWLTRPDHDLLLSTRGNGPIRNSTYLKPEFSQVNQAAPVIVEAIKYGTPGLPAVAKRPEIMVLINQELNAGVAGNKTPRQVVDDITSGVNKLLV